MKKTILSMMMLAVATVGVSAQTDSVSSRAKALHNTKEL